MGRTVELSFCQTDKLRERDISSNANKLLNMCCAGNKRRARVRVVCPSTVLNSMNEFIKLLYSLVWPQNPQSHDNNYEFDRWKKEGRGRWKQFWNRFKIDLKIGKETKIFHYWLLITLNLSRQIIFINYYFREENYLRESIIFKWNMKQDTFSKRVILTLLNPDTFATYN